MTASSVADRQVLLDRLDELLFAVDRLDPDRPNEAVADIVDAMYAMFDLTEALPGETAALARYPAQVGLPTAAAMNVSLTDQLHGFGILARHVATSRSYAPDDNVVSEP